MTPRIAVLTVALAAAPALAPAATCDSLSTLSLPHTRITTAQTVAAGAFTAPARGGRGANFSDLPAFCRVQATLTPTSDSDIKMELWLPEAGWNGKFRGTGNGGLGGGTGANPGALANGLRRGYATAGNNTGHEGDSSYAMSHPEQIKDFGYRAAHEMTVASKAIIKAFYGTAPKYSYMAEGGGGTIAALSAAQRYPDDYDAIAVTGMSSYLTRHTFGQMWIWQATHKDAASYIPPSKYPVLHKAALDACDALDGLKDGVIGDVLHCKFDPGVTLCKGGDAPDCLTAPQVEAAKKIYAGPHNPRTGEEIYSPLFPGSELGWAQLAGGDQPLGIPIDFFKYYVFRDPTWDYKTRPINFDSDVTASNRPDIQPVNAVNPDLSKFFARGGKLLLVDGWADTAVPPKVSINYHEAVVKKLGEKRVAASMRYFMVPGMGHGPGTNGAENFNFDALGLIEQWNERGVAPDQLIVAHFKDGKQVGSRLVCQFPHVATYRGSGNAEEPASYSCK
ncbi:MAG TPA: tannase/feruloyl esterase family alpha/beta hydrolase [Vicinamibacterales bacterium]|nr:tannase/feruloyl esterase family alpha/beta hydrolase [Vicinamibacterales bacterium]